MVQRTPGGAAESQSRPLRLLVVVPAYEPAWAFGGVVRSVSNLYRSLAQVGADVEVYTTNEAGEGKYLPVPVATPMSVHGVTVTYFPSSLGPSRAWASRPLQHRLEQTISGFDILYVSAVWQWIGIAACCIARRNHVPYVVSPHGSFLPQALQCHRLRKRVFWHSFLARCVQAAHAVRFTTEYERRGSRAFLPAKPSFMVPNPVLMEGGPGDDEAGRLDARRQFGLSDDDFLLLTVTRAHPDKRVDVIIEALARMRRTGRKARLLVVGPFDNDYGTQLKALAARHNVSEAILWAGYRDDAALAACYRASDVFVLPSAHENFCMAAAEAMACGLPVVLSKHVGIAEDVQRHEAGLVTEVDAEQVADAALALLDTQRRREMGRRARETAARLYDGARVARLVLRAFEDILSGVRSPECAWLLPSATAGDMETQGTPLPRADSP